MAMKERPQVREITGGKCWEHEFEKFFLKVYVPDNDIDGQTNNYGFRAPLLLVFEEEKQDMDSAAAFARETGLAGIAARFDSSVLFVYPKAEGSWAAEDESLYAAVIAEIKMIQVYQDGIVENYDFFAKEFRGYFVRGAIFRADILPAGLPVPGARLAGALFVSGVRRVGAGGAAQRGAGAVGVGLGVQPLPRLRGLHRASGHRLRQPAAVLRRRRRRRRRLPVLHGNRARAGGRGREMPGAETLACDRRAEGRGERSVGGRLRSRGVGAVARPARTRGGAVGRRRP